MRQSRYPLEQVRELRVRAYQEAELELTRARGRVHDAQQALTAAEHALQAHTAKRAKVVTPEAGEPVSSQALARLGMYAARLQAEGQKLKAHVKTAQAALAAEARALRLAELTWQRAYTDREMLSRHHERFLESQRKAAERAEELEIEDLWHPAHRPQVRT